jgi:hypothetical protein
MSPRAAELLGLECNELLPSSDWPAILKTKFGPGPNYLVAIRSEVGALLALALLGQVNHIHLEEPGRKRDPQIGRWAHLANMGVRRGRAREGIAAELLIGILGLADLLDAWGIWCFPADESKEWFRRVGFWRLTRPLLEEPPGQEGPGVDPQTGEPVHYPLANKVWAMSSFAFGITAGIRLSRRGYRKAWDHYPEEPEPPRDEYWEPPIWTHPDSPWISRSVRPDAGLVSKAQRQHDPPDEHQALYLVEIVEDRDLLADVPAWFKEHEPAEFVCPP